MTERDWDWGYHDRSAIGDGRGPLGRATTAEKGEQEETVAAARERAERGGRADEREQRVRAARVREASRAASAHRGSSPAVTGMVDVGMGLSTGIEEVEPQRQVRSAAIATGVAGAGLIVAGASRRTWWGKLLGMVPGAWLVASGASMLRGQRRAARPGVTAKATAVHLEERIQVDREPRDVYERFRDLQQLPQLLHGGHHVHLERSGRIHWAAQIAPNLRIEWDGEIIDDEPGRVITWASMPAEPIDETGSIVFEPGRFGGTDVTVRLAYRVGSGALGAAVGTAMAGFTSAYIAAQLARLKASLEEQHAVIGSTK